MKSVYPDVIAESQTGFMETRQISQSIRITLDVSKHNKHVPGYLLSLDFEKCFRVLILYLKFQKNLTE